MRLPPRSVPLVLCLEVAKRAKFEPAVRGSRRVSRYVLIEYNFNTY